jgi:hypothetical protein
VCPPIHQRAEGAVRKRGREGIHQIGQYLKSKGLGE